MLQRVASRHHPKRPCPDPRHLKYPCRLDMPLTSWGSRVRAFVCTGLAASLTVLAPTGSYLLVRAAAGHGQALSRSTCIHRTCRGTTRWKVVKPSVFQTMTFLRRRGTCVRSRPTTTHPIAGRVLLWCASRAHFRGTTCLSTCAVGQTSSAPDVPLPETRP